MFIENNNNNNFLSVPQTGIRNRKYSEQSEINILMSSERCGQTVNKLELNSPLFAAEDVCQQ